FRFLLSGPAYSYFADCPAQSAAPWARTARSAARIRVHFKLLEPALRSRMLMGKTCPHPSPLPEGEGELKRTLNIIPFCRSAAAAGGRLRPPPPARVFRHVVAMLADIVLVLDEPISQRLLEVGGASAELRQPIDHVHDQMEPVQLVQNDHVERG